MERLPVLPLGQLVVYPHVVLPLALTDPKAVQLIDEVIQGEKRVLLGVTRSRTSSTMSGRSARSFACSSSATARCA